MVRSAENRLPGSEPMGEIKGADYAESGGRAKVEC
jgi:hypothetical protein